MAGVIGGDALAAIIFRAPEIGRVDQASLGPKLRHKGVLHALEGVLDCVLQGEVVGAGPADNVDVVRRIRGDVPPSDNIFRELGNNTYDFKDLLSELIDNSIAARPLDPRLKIQIERELHLL